MTLRLKICDLGNLLLGKQFNFESADINYPMEEQLKDGYCVINITNDVYTIFYLYKGVLRYLITEDLEPREKDNLDGLYYSLVTLPQKSDLNELLTDVNREVNSRAEKNSKVKTLKEYYETDLFHLVDKCRDVYRFQPVGMFKLIYLLLHETDFIDINWRD